MPDPNDEEWETIKKVEVPAGNDDWGDPPWKQAEAHGRGQVD